MSPRPALPCANGLKAPALHSEHAHNVVLSVEGLNFTASHVMRIITARALTVLQLWI